jgi:integrase
MTEPSESYTLPLFRTFDVIAKEWLRSKSVGISSNHRYIKPWSHKTYQGDINALIRFFGHQTMDEIRACPDGLTKYQVWRSSKAGPNKITHELQTFIAILKREGAWTEEHALNYLPFRKEETDIPRALTPPEQELWLETAKGNPKWLWVYWLSVLGFRTAASVLEIRCLTIGDVNLEGAYIRVTNDNAKNRYRVRSIPIAGDAFDATCHLLTRAKKVGASQPWHYLFPRRVALHYDPTRHIGDLVPWWGEIRVTCGLHGFQPSHLRHTAITRMAEAGTPIPVIMSMAGHVTRKMCEHYTWISEHAKRQAIKAVAEGTAYQKPIPEKRPGSVNTVLSTTAFLTGTVSGTD